MPTNHDRLEAAIDSAFEALKTNYGKIRNDYYGLIYFEKVLRIRLEDALSQVAFGNSDLGIDGFTFDQDEGVYRLFQFKNSKNPSLLHDSMRIIADKGIPALFDRSPIPDHQPIVDAARRELHRCAPSLQRAQVDFVFRGDVDSAINTQIYPALSEEIEKHSWRFAEITKRDEFPLQARVFHFDGILPEAPIERYVLHFVTAPTSIQTEDGARMHVGLVPLIDIVNMFNGLGSKFLERNIRFGLGSSGHVNRALARAIREVLLEKADPTAFALHHNGLTVSAAELRTEEDPPVVLAPRLLNGAQTISSFARVIEELGARFQGVSAERVRSLAVVCRIITGARPEVVRRITMDSNRQNPIDSWLLRANDLIQLKFADFFRRLGIYYERQANAFQALTEQEREDASIEDVKPIQMLKLARTYLAVEGKLSRLSQLGEVADSESQYTAIFNESRLQCDPRNVVFCYKVQFNLRMLVNSILDVGPNKYAFIHRGKDMIWALVCQAFLNDEKRAELAEEFGSDLRRPANYIERLDYYASRARIILSRLVSEPPYSSMIQQDSYSFLRKEETYNRAMNIAADRWSWRPRLLQ